MDHEQAVIEAIEEHKVNPVDIMSIGDQIGEYIYLRSHMDSYVRTVRDIDELLGSGQKGKHILEIGSFLGPVSMALKRLGYAVSALDIPEFQRSAQLQRLYRDSGIDFVGHNLRSGNLPYESQTFDAVIACEIIEHFNFNPLPVLSEMNRVIKSGGYIYIGMPNQAFFLNRIRLLLGKSVQGDIDEFFDQLDRSKNMVVGLHWREYTLNETVQMISRMGFEPVRSYYFAARSHGSSRMKRVARSLLYAYPPFRPFQVVAGKKRESPTFDFWRTEANS